MKKEKNHWHGAVDIMASCRFVLFVNVLFFNFRITVTGKLLKGTKGLLGA